MSASRQGVIADSFYSDAAAKEVEGDYKGESKFASHMKTQAAASHFAKTRTLKEQREYLPAFACREDLMRTLRDNQGKKISTDMFLNA